MSITSAIVGVAASDATQSLRSAYCFSASIAAAISASLRAEFFAPAVNAAPDHPNSRRKIITPSVDVA